MSHISTPTELLYTIIRTVWESPLTPHERIHFMTSSKLVSHTWTAVFTEISATDVHIPCESFYHRYFSDDNNNNNDDDDDDRSSRCKRITFTLYDPDRQRALTHPYARTLSHMRHAHIAKLTALQCIRIVFHDSVFPDPYAQGFFSALPAYLPTLVVSYTFSQAIPASFVEHYRRRFERKSKIRYAAPRVGTLVVNGADEFIAAVWESLFPGRQRLVRDGEESGQLMNVTSVFSTYQALLVRLEDIQRQRQREEEHESRQHAAVSDNKPHGIRVVGGDDERMTFMTANPAHDAPPRFLARSRVGDVGYVDSFSGQFVLLFNALEPHITQSSSAIPSLSGYGDVCVRSRLRLRSSKKEKGSEGIVDRLAYFAQAVFQLRGARKEYVDTSEDGAAFKWFNATAASVVKMYGKLYGFNVEDVVLVTGALV